MIAYHASHEQFSPSHLLTLAKAAEEAGFDAIHSSDHFHPWSTRQGQSGFAFSWIAAAMQVSSLPFSMVCAPGQRYHPAIVAQAITTIAEMFPGRFSVELGSGEALNEKITGTSWPAKKIRNERLEESAGVIRKLLSGQEVTYHGHINVRNARLYTLPKQLPALFCCALSEETARWGGSWADGLLTTGGDPSEVATKIRAFKEKSSADKPVYVQFAFSYAADRAAAIDGAYDQWRSNLISVDKLAEFSVPGEFDEESENISRERVAERFNIYTDISEIMQMADDYIFCGATRVILHNVNTNQEEFIEAYKQFKQR